MAILSVIYVLRSISECVDFTAKAKRALPGEVVNDVACDLPTDFKQLAILVLSTISSAAMLAYKLSLCEQIRLRIAFRDVVKAQRDKLLEELNSIARGEVTGASQAATANPVQLAGLGAGALPGGSGSQASVVSAPSSMRTQAPAPRPSQSPLNPEFTVMRNPPSGGSTGPSGAIARGPQDVAATELRRDQPSGISSLVGMRGTCLGCNRSVMSTDEGRVKEGENYYHRACVKGPCSKCGKNVYAEQERGREGPEAAYFHIACPS
jgi:hypothetical protein